MLFRCLTFHNRLQLSTKDFVTHCSIRLLFDKHSIFIFSKIMKELNYGRCCWCCCWMYSSFDLRLFLSDYKICFYYFFLLHFYFAERKTSKFLLLRTRFHSNAKRERERRKTFSYWFAICFIQAKSMLSVALGFFFFDQHEKPVSIRLIQFHYLHRYWISSKYLCWSSRLSTIWEIRFLFFSGTFHRLKIAFQVLVCVCSIDELYFVLQRAKERRKSSPDCSIGFKEHRKNSSIIFNSFFFQTSLMSTRELNISKASIKERNICVRILRWNRSFFA